MLLASGTAFTTGCGGGDAGSADQNGSANRDAGPPDQDGGSQGAVETTGDGTRRCPPTPRPAQPTSQQDVGSEATLRLQLRKYGTAFVVNVEGVERTTEVGGAGGYAAQGGEFIVVSYRVRNVGEAPLKAAVVNGLFGINTGGRVDYGPAEAASGCKASGHFAKRADPAAEVAERDVSPGESYRTIAAYVVPRAKRRVSWVASDGSYKVRLSVQSQ